MNRQTLMSSPGALPDAATLDHVATQREKKSSSRTQFHRRLLLIIAFLSAAATVFATSTYLANFRTAYPAAASSQLNSCVLCHLDPNGGGTRNAYGEAFRAAGHSFTAIESLDSDGDGFTNLQEIQALTFPGDAASHPPATPPPPPPPPPPADTTAPTVTAFTIPASASSLTVTITSFTASDNVAVTGYMVTQSSTAPSAGATGWTASAPMSYTFPAAGGQTLYAWAKDAAGNVSAGRSASTSITLPSGGDTTPPTVTGFSFTSSSSSLTVTISLLAATDNVGVTGYLVTATAAAPSASASGWTATPPSSFTFAAAGVESAYAWAKDAAGNVSAGRSASTTITLPAAQDTVRPSVTAFALPSISGALAIQILSFAASDNVGVTGYMLTETSAAPASGSASWTPVAPSRYTFGSYGAKTVYAWAKDAAGNISASRSANINVVLPPLSGVPKSINSTSQNRSAQPQSLAAEQTPTRLAGYQILAANDLGMHCGDLDQRVASILPPFNVVHAQVVQQGHMPRILDNGEVEVLYSAASNPQDPAQVNAIPTSVYKTDFWDTNARTGNTLAFDAFDAYYPAGILSLFRLVANLGLPVPDLQRLYLGDHTLAADQQAMPGSSSRYNRSGNTPRPFALYYRSIPFFINFPFGYTLSNINWFSAEGIPVTPYDDSGRQNPYPLMRVQARAISGNSIGVSSGSVIASLDTVTPVSGEVDCSHCHSSAADGGSGAATDGLGFVVATKVNDPRYGSVPEAVSIEWAFDTNILRLHDRNEGTNLQASTPVSCQKCHYTPALDLAHVGPNDVNGRQQTSHQSFSRVMHGYHGSLGMFPEMPSPVGRSAAVRDDILNKSCYQCHPGRTTQCFRGAMYNAGQACQDCHGNMAQVGNDFTGGVSRQTPGNFALAGDFYTNPQTRRVPWANEPMCQSCHTGDVNNNLTASTNVVKSPDGLRLIQAFRSGDAMAKPIVATNRRFAENQSGSGATTKQVLYRLSLGHGGVFCEGCHGSTHAEWPNAIANANDNVAATQLQGHSGKIVECSTCHGTGAFTSADFRGNFDANKMMRGPHGMHPVDQSWVSMHPTIYRDSATPAGTCQACHGSQLQGSPLAKMAADRTFNIDDGRTRTIAKGTVVSCSLCHGNPSSSSSGGDR